ncbi:MAG TPA: hypothetical protein VH394_25520 [Thermoanaerobaculia bacterium]|nr:hypothetical protein [Thermoanaerobaculia bacterium]
MLLLLGYDRITLGFFHYLVDDSLEYRTGSAFNSLEQLQVGTERFRKLALLHFGNVKFAFKNLSQSPEMLQYYWLETQPRDEAELISRHDPVQPLIPIPGGDTFYLGYIVQRDLKGRLAKDPKDPVALAGERKQAAVVSAGIRNHVAYLASDHLDVYIATSMREPHEYLLVNRLTGAIFDHPRLRELKLRWFDPTQAYCHDRIDKGLSEALMLRRAKCTVYFVQETDTLGKDSELASTLAQGKPVIAFVPQADKAYAIDLLGRLQEIYPEKTKRELILEQLRVFDPGAAWNDSTVREWLSTPKRFGVDEAMGRLTKAIREHYDKRARMLREDHPLGIQVNLETGVANGVLVARSVEECSELIRRVLTRTLEFELEVKWLSDMKYVFLRETVSGSIFRVMSGDPMLTNAFWNFYLGD